MDPQPNIPLNRVILEDGRWDWGKGREAQFINFKRVVLVDLVKKITSEQSLEGGVVL